MEKSLGSSERILSTLLSRKLWCDGIVIDNFLTFIHNILYQFSSISLCVFLHVYIHYVWHFDCTQDFLLTQALDIVYIGHRLPELHLVYTHIH